PRRKSRTVGERGACVFSACAGSASASMSERSADKRWLMTILTAEGNKGSDWGIEQLDPGERSAMHVARGLGQSSHARGGGGVSGGGGCVLRNSPTGNMHRASL